MFIILSLVACNNEVYPNRPSDVNKEIWEQSNKTYDILEENWKLIELPSEYDVETFFSIHDKYMDDIKKTSQNEYDLLNNLTKMLYYLSEFQRMGFSTKETFTDNEKYEMVILYESSKREVAKILGRNIDE